MSERILCRECLHGAELPGGRLVACHYGPALLDPRPTFDETWGEDGHLVAEGPWPVFLPDDFCDHGERTSAR